jgi:serine/threonine-protein kinase
VIDPIIVARLLRHRRNAGPLSALTDREREVLELMAEGRSNAGISEQLILSPKTVEGHVNNNFRKLGIGITPSQHRRVIAVLTFLRARGATRGGSAHPELVDPRLAVGVEREVARPA